MSRAYVAVLSALLLLLTGCQIFTVPNPDYAAWAHFEPGSYVTFEGEQRVGDEVQPIRITEKLIAKDAEYVLLERTTGDGSGPAVPRVEKARIDPAEDPRTHPNAVIRDLGMEDVEVAGQIFHCPVRELELHAETEGFITNVQDMYGRAAVSPDMPGRFVKVFLRTKTPHHESEMTGQIVDFLAIRKEQ